MTRDDARDRGQDGRVVGLTKDAQPDAPETAAQDGVALDLLLTDLASMRERFLPGRSIVKLAAELPRHPARSGERAASFVTDLIAIAAGRSGISPTRSDRRFVDPAWTESGVFRRLMQSYLALADLIDVAIDDANLDLQEERRIRLAVENLLAASAPTNFLVSNPAALRTMMDTRGLSLVRGLRNFTRDIRREPRLPANTRTSHFELGEDLAATPGAVILRTEVFELIQYGPQTPSVRSTPVVFVPPMINKYYLLDLAPGRSLVEHLVQQGQQVFALSWRNPGKAQASWNLDTYAGAVVEAISAVSAITGAESCHLAGSCSGGALAAAVTAHLVATSQRDKISSLMLAVCVIDSERAGVASAFKSRRATEASVSKVARKGYLDGHVLQAIFAWLRPQDLIWPYVVNNYLLGQEPPPFDILYWNADTTCVGAGLYADLADLALDNSLAHPGMLNLLGTPIDLATVDIDSYVVAGVADHITPWENCYRTTQLLGGDVRFILSTSGHVAALVCPVTNTKASYRAASGRHPADSERWLQTSSEHSGSWWSDWSEWLADRSGPDRPAPRKLGDRRFRVLHPAPGTYVLTADAEKASANTAAQKTSSVKPARTRGRTKKASKG